MDVVIQEVGWGAVFLEGEKKGQHWMERGFVPIYSVCMYVSPSSSGHFLLTKAESNSLRIILSKTCLVSRDCSAYGPRLEPCRLGRRGVLVLSAGMCTDGGLRERMTGYRFL